jgi:hypothetical protein
MLILTKAAEAFDRADQARETLREKGVTFLDRFDQPSPEIVEESQPPFAAFDNDFRPYYRLNFGGSHRAGTAATLIRFQ